MILYQVVTADITAGVVVNGNQIVAAQPILAWARGKHLLDIRRWARQRGGAVECIGPISWET